jgi:hypothetical protein
MAFEGFKPEEKGSDNFAVARALFSTPQELFAKVSANDAGIDSQFGALGVTGSSGSSTALWKDGGGVEAPAANYMAANVQPMARVEV